MKNILISLALLSLLLSACQQRLAEEKPYLIIVSLDGFRWDYTDSVATPNFDVIEESD